MFKLAVYHYGGLRGWSSVKRFVARCPDDIKGSPVAKNM